MSQTGPDPLDPDGFVRLVEREGATVARRDGRIAGPGVEAFVIEQGDVEFDAPPLARHFLGLVLDGAHRGAATADGLATGTRLEGRPGRLSFLPAERGARVVAAGSATYLQLLIDPAIMDRVMDERLVGGAGAALFACNTVLNPALERLARAVADALLAPTEALSVGDALALDDLGRRLCEALVADYADAATVRRGGEPPRLSALALGRALDRIDEGSDEDLRLEALAREASMAPGEFAEAFDRATGQSLGEYLRERRVDRVREHLRTAAANEPRSARALAARFGFGSARALERAFRTQTGTDLPTGRRV